MGLLRGRAPRDGDHGTGPAGYARGGPGGRSPMGPFAGAPPRRRLWWWRHGFTALVLAAGAIGLVLHFVHPRPTRPPVSIYPTRHDGPRASAPAAVPGWQAVVSSTGTFAYDVPPAWRVSRLGEDIPLVNGPWHLDLTMPAGYLQGYCAGKDDSYRGQSGYAAVPADPAGAATDAARQAADLLARPGASTAPPNVALDAPRQVPVGAVTGTLVTARITFTAPGPCDPQAILLDVVAVPSRDRHGSVLMLAYADQGFPEATAQADLDRLVTSLRVLTPPAPTATR